MYDAQLGRWHVVDPLAEKFNSYSTYNYVLNNPLKYVDPDGKDVQFAPGVSDEFKKAFAEAVQYMNKHGVAGMLASLHKSETTYYIAEGDWVSNYDSKTKTITWDPNMGVSTTNDKQLSPTAVLNHEIDHANQNDKNPEQYKKDNQRGNDSQYGTKEEKRVIEGSEQETGRKTGEIKPNEITRDDHDGAKYDTKGPTTTKPVTTIPTIKKEPKE